jgi:uncharacterized membrane protein YqaE (UPF0057 family)
MRKKALLVCFPVLMLLLSNNSFAAFSSKEDKKAVSQPIAQPSDVTMKEAMKEFTSLSRHEKKSRMKQVKKAIKEYTAQKKAGNDVDTNTLLLIIIAILIPPLAVYLHEGEINNKFWIAVLLTLLGLLIFGSAGILFFGTLPGIIYALYVLLSGTKVLS